VLIYYADVLLAMHGTEVNIPALKSKHANGVGSKPEMLIGKRSLSFPFPPLRFLSLFPFSPLLIFLPFSVFSFRSGTFKNQLWGLKKAL